MSLMKIRTLIVDDEPLARRGISARLREFPDFEIIGECDCGEKAIDAIQSQQPALVFLDVQMPDLTGFEVLQTLGAEKMPEVIFVTAFDQHALRAFEVNALDYLLKPIDDERFALAVARVREELRQRHDNTLARRLANLLSQVQTENAGVSSLSDSNPSSQRFIVKSGGRILFVKAHEIDWVEAAGDYVYLHVGTKSHLLRESMTTMENQLDPQQFLRIHRSTIINSDRIGEMRPRDNGEYKILLHTGVELTASRRYRQRVQDFFGGKL